MVWTVLFPHCWLTLDATLVGNEMPYKCKWGNQIWGLYCISKKVCEGANAVFEIVSIYRTGTFTHIRNNVVADPLALFTNLYEQINMYFVL